MSDQSAKRVIYDSPSKHPNESVHWKRVFAFSTADLNEKDVINSHEELVSAFKSDVSALGNDAESYTQLAMWSCIIGYCEALSTHKDEGRRYVLFPVPYASLRKLACKFVDSLSGIKDEASKIFTSASNDPKSKPSNKNLRHSSLHRSTVQTLSNSIWKQAQNKSQMKDELHANSLYICLCGDIDNKSLDCFGAALLTVIGMNILGFESCLTLSEDHAYESHWEEDANAAIPDSTEITGNDFKIATKRRATCEVAIPGNTKAIQSKRGREISETFAESKSPISPDTSWLYMASNAVICDTPGMILAAILGNVNCDVEKLKKSAINDDKPQTVSGAMYKLKRDMLWILYEAGYMEKFPFAIMELGECEEHFGSDRGMSWVDVSELVQSKVDKDDVGAKHGDETMALMNEKLFLDAMNISRIFYEDSQVYPYLYAGHYHKDAGRKSSSDEYRLVEALRLYSEAGRVASKYKYDAKDCMQLMKHMTTVASLIQKDILLLPANCEDGKCIRVWVCQKNAVAAATWVLSFYDALLFWEEKEQNMFVEVLGIAHKFSLAKIFQYFPFDVRLKAIAELYSSDLQNRKYSMITENQMLYFTNPLSKRLANGSLLIIALSKEKIALKDLDLALPIIDGSTRQRKRARRN